MKNLEQKAYTPGCQFCKLIYKVACPCFFVKKFVPENSRQNMVNENRFHSNNHTFTNFNNF